MTVADTVAPGAAPSSPWARLRPPTITGQLAAVVAALLLTSLLAGAALVLQAIDVGRPDQLRDQLLTNRRESYLVLVEDYARLDAFHAMLAAGTNSSLRAKRRAQYLAHHDKLHALVAAMRAHPANAEVKAGFDAFAREFERSDALLDRADEEFAASGGRDAVSADTTVGAVETDALVQLQALNERINVLAVQAQNAQVKRIDARIRDIAVIGLILLVVIGTVAVLVIRRLVRPVVQLTSFAEVAARTELPAAVAQVRSSEDGAAPALEPVRIAGTIETTRLARAFEEVRATAVDLAVEQRRAEKDSAQMLVNLGHRNQNLLNRTLAYITELERTEQDPDVLDRLFRLDHATTRIRRNAESMLVLAGAGQTRSWSRPAPVADVVRAALSEIEDYDRVDVYHVQHAGLTGSVVADVVHLLAELMENAANFSPPSTSVTVVGQTVPDGYRIRIIDEGIGMTRAELEAANRTIQRAGEGRTASKLLGLYVVGRLAARRGIGVTLEASGGRGVTATVVLPAALLAEVAEIFPVDDVPAEAGRISAAPSVMPVSPAPSLVPAPQPAPVRRPAPATAAHRADLLQAVAPAPEPVAPAPAPAPVATSGATPRRVPGAQLPDLGFGTEAEPDLAEVDAADVRGRLSSLQRGVAAGRRAEVTELPVRPEPVHSPDPAEGYPGEGYPGAGYPAEGYPAEGYPADGYPADEVVLDLTGEAAGDRPATDGPGAGPALLLTAPIETHPGKPAVPVRVPGAQLPELGLLDDAPDSVLSPASGDANRWKLRSFQLDVDAARRAGIPADASGVRSADVIDRPEEEA